MTQQEQPQPNALIVPTEGMTIAAWEATKANMEQQGYTYAPTMAVFTRPVGDVPTGDTTPPADEQAPPTPLANARNKASHAATAGVE